MLHTPQLAKINALLNAHEMDSMEWCEYAYQTGAAMLAKLTTEDRKTLFRDAITKPAHWRGCLVSILHPLNFDEGEELIRALDDADPDIASEALRRIYFFCGLNRSAKKGVFEDRLIQIDAFKKRVVRDEGVMGRIQQLSEAGVYLEYWHVLAGQ
jgi:hypothetical protein